jgi:hypothetical protein
VFQAARRERTTAKLGGNNRRNTRRDKLKLERRERGKGRWVPEGEWAMVRGLEGLLSIHHIEGSAFERLRCYVSAVLDSKV